MAVSVKRQLSFLKNSKLAGEMLQSCHSSGEGRSQRAASENYICRRETFIMECPGQHVCRWSYIYVALCSSTHIYAAPPTYM